MEYKNVIFGVVLLVIGAALGSTYPITNNSKAENNVTINQEIPQKNGKIQEIQENFGKININTADISALKSIGGIGNKKAKKIIERREKNKFTSIYQLVDDGILGVETFEKNKNKMTVGD